MALIPDIIDAIFILFIGSIGYYIGKDKGYDRGSLKAGEEGYKLGYQEGSTGKPHRYPEDES